MTFVGSPDEPLTLQLVERSRTADAIVPVGALRVPLPGGVVDVELSVDIDANGVMVIELADLTNKAARAYHLDEREGGFSPKHRARLLAEGWTLHVSRRLTPTSITDDTAVETAGETIATIDAEAELAWAADAPVDRGYLLIGLDRAGEALGLLMPLLAERPPYEYGVPEVCTATCVALAKVPPQYRQAGVRAVVDRLVHVTSRPTYRAKTDPQLALCVTRLDALGPSQDVARFTEHLARVS
jgi:hypothetical protein